MGGTAFLYIGDWETEVSGEHEIPRPYHKANGNGMSPVEWSMRRGTDRVDGPRVEALEEGNVGGQKTIDIGTALRRSRTGQRRGW